VCEHTCVYVFCVGGCVTGEKLLLANINFKDENIIYFYSRIYQ